MAFLKCVFSKGGFSGEAVFEVQPNGEKHVGVASRLHCWSENGRRLVDVDLENNRISGFIAVRIVDEDNDNNRVLVSMPDGEVIWVAKDKLIPPEAAPNVPVRPRLAVGN